MAVGSPSVVRTVTNCLPIADRTKVIKSRDLSR